MTAGEWAAWVALATAGAGLLTGMLGILRYFNYRTRRDRVAAVGASLDLVVASLAADNDVQRAAAAIRLRRFFDRRSELGVSGAAYATDALNVMAAVLRQFAVGNVQKLLADGLAHAPSLAGADLQRTNLCNAYLARTDLAGADLFQADLSDSSLKEATARGATFYRTRMARCVMTGADLRDATFHGADLRGVQLAGALLTGARFVDCENVPAAVAAGLTAEGVYAGPDPVPAAPAVATRCRIFLSHPYRLAPRQSAILERVVTTIETNSADVVTIEARDASPAGILSDLRAAMAECSAVVVLGLTQIRVTDGRGWAETPSEDHLSGLALPTPWNHVEAGLAAGLGLPLFRIREDGPGQGAFDPLADAWPVADLSTAGLENVLVDLRSWVAQVATRQ